MQAHKLLQSCEGDENPFRAANQRASVLWYGVAHHNSRSPRADVVHFSDSVCAITSSHSVCATGVLRGRTPITALASLQAEQLNECAEL